MSQKAWLEYSAWLYLARSHCIVLGRMVFACMVLGCILLLESDWVLNSCRKYGSQLLGRIPVSCIQLSHILELESQVFGV